MVEFALALPLLMALIVGGVETGRAYSLKEAVTNSARQALRIAVSSTEETGTLHPGKSACQARGATYTGRATGTAWLPADSTHVSDTFMADIAKAAWLETSTDGTTTTSRLYSAANPSQLQVTWSCVNGLPVSNPSSTTANTTAAQTSDPTAACTSAATCPDSIAVTVTMRFTTVTVPPRVFPAVNIAFSALQRAEY